MKRIIIINQYGATPDVPGATKHFDMAQYFASKKKYNVEYWLSGLNHKTGKNHKSLKGIKIQSKEQMNEKFKIVRIKGFKYSDNLILRQLSIILFEILTATKILVSKNISYIIINTPPVGFVNIFAAKLRKKKIIIDVEDLWPLFLVDMGLSNKLAIKYMELAANYGYKSAYKISTVSQGMYNYVSEIKGSSNNVWVSPLGIDLKEYLNVKPNNKLIENKKWKEDFKIMYLGAHGRANNLDAVLNTIKKFNEKYQTKIGNKEISFIFIGDGDQKNFYMEYARENDISNVFFEDAVPSSVVSEYLIHADVCLTNLQKIESFKLVRPNKLFQYMALEKPIITGIWGEFQQIIEEYNAGIYVDFTQPEDAASKIYKFIQYEDLRSVGKRGLEYIKLNGDRDKIFEKYYNELDADEQLFDR